MRTVATSVDLVVHLGLEVGGHRRVREIVGVTGRVEGDIIETADIFTTRNGRLDRADGIAFQELPASKLVGCVNTDGPYCRGMPKPSHRGAIISAGLQTMFRKGYVGASVRDIVSTAGAPQGSFTITSAQSPSSRTAIRRDD